MQLVCHKSKTDCTRKTGMSGGINSTGSSPHVHRHASLAGQRERQASLATPRSLPDAIARMWSVKRDKVILPDLGDGTRGKNMLAKPRTLNLRSGAPFARSASRMAGAWSSAALPPAEQPATSTSHACARPNCLTSSSTVALTVACPVETVLLRSRFGSSARCRPAKPRPSQLFM
eukprot:5935468-Prymnesium_polylepis.3